MLQADDWHWSSFAAILSVTGCGGDTPVAPEVHLVVSDWGSGTSEQEAFAAAMGAHAVSTNVGAILTTGGEFYSDDAEQSMTELSDCPADGPATIAAESAHHLLTLEQAENLSVSAIDVNGVTLDESELALP